MIILNFKNFCSLKGTIKKQAVGQLSATHLTNQGLITSKVYKELPQTKKKVTDKFNKNMGRVLTGTTLDDDHSILFCDRSEQKTIQMF